MLREGEIIVDLFAGGGGASHGIRMATGRDPDVAVNHDPVAVAMHAANHPDTRHLRQDVWQVPPRWASQGKPVGLLWASPDCTHHSKAKGSAPRRDAKIRDLAWVVEKWAGEVRPRIICLENVEEFRDWGPLDKEGKVIRSQKGTTFTAFVRSLRAKGYRVEWSELSACDYGAPTTRKRLFLVARRDGLDIVWPESTHGPGCPLPYRTAGEIIDFSIPCPSIFERKKPLAEATLKRIAHGIMRYVIECAKPFIVTCNHGGDGFRGQGLDQPFKTITASRDAHGLVVPCLVGVGGRAGQSRPRGVNEPGATTTAKADVALVDAFLAKHYENGVIGQRLDQSIGTVTTIDHHSLVAPTLIQTGYGERQGQTPRSLDIEKPLGTIMAGGGKHGLVSAFLAKHYGGVVGQQMNHPIGTVTTVDHHSLVACNLIRHFGASVGQSVDEPVRTIMPGGSGKTALVASHIVKFKGTSKDGQAETDPLHTVQTAMHYGEVRAFLMKYYGCGGNAVGCESPLATITSKDRMGLVTTTIRGEPYAIVDIGMRMLGPRELFRAQGFPDSYIIDILIDGRLISKANQVRMCGNSVSPQAAAALVSSNLNAAEIRGRQGRGKEMLQLSLFAHKER